MAATLDFTHNVMLEVSVLFDHTSMADIPENTTVDTSITNVLLLCRK